MSRRFTPDAAYARSIRERRRALAMSQNALALMVGVAEATIGKWERMASAVPDDTRVAIDAAFTAAEAQEAPATRCPYCGR